MAEVVSVGETMTPVLGAPEVTVTSNVLKDMNASSSLESDSSSGVGSTVDADVVGKPSPLPTPKKKFRETDGDPMDIGLENKENLIRGLKTLSRKELEDLILVKIVEAMVQHSETGKYRTKLAEMQMQRDRMQNRVSHLQKQVMEMGRALKVVLDNQSRDPNNLLPKRSPPAMKFFRSVGLQVTIEPSFKNGPTKIVHVNNTATVPFQGTTMMKTLNNHSPPVLKKRPGPKSLTDPRAKMANGGIVGKQMNGYGHGHINPTRVATTSLVAAPKQQMGATPTVVDLTDDSMNEGSSGNGVHCKVVKPGQKGAPAGGYLISGGGQGQNTQNRTTMSQRPRPSSSSSTPSNAAAVVRTYTGKSTLPNFSTSKKISLPAMPPPISSAVNLPRGVVFKELPPKPTLTLSEQVDGIVISWMMKLAGQHADVASYQIYACQESLASPSLSGKPSPWKRVGDVKSLPLPMACTLSQFTQGNRYFFIVRAVDQYGRSGPFCDPGPIVLQKKNKVD